MAKLVQLKQIGVEVFPRTVSNAVAVEAKNRLLSTVLTDVETEALGWHIEPTVGVASGLSYTLWKKIVDESGVTRDVSASTFTIAQDANLESVTYVADSEHVPSGHEAPQGQEFPALLMVFNTNSAGTPTHSDIWVSLKALVDVYEGDGKAITIETQGATDNGIITFHVSNAAGNILTIENDGVLATIAATGDTYVGAAIDANEKNKVVVSADVAQTFSAVTGSETASGQLADAAQVKEYIDVQVSDLSISAEGDDYVSAAVDASDKKRINVGINTASVTFDSATSALTIGDTAGLVTNQGATAIKNYIDAKAQSLDASVDSTGGSYIGVNVVEENGVVTSVTVTEDIQAVASADSSNMGLAEASDVKAYVDAKSAGVTILDSNDIDATSGTTGTSLAINFANSGVTSSAVTNNPVFNDTQALAVNGKQVYVWGVTAEDKGDITITWPGEETQNSEPEEP